MNFKKITIIRLAFVILAVVTVPLVVHYQDSFKYKVTFSKSSPSNTGVTHYDRLRTDDKKYLLLDSMGIDRQTCTILDYDGNIVHNFPHGACKFSRAGDLYHVSFNVVAFDKDARVKWRTKDYMQHHTLEFSEATQELFFAGVEQTGPSAGTEIVVALNAEGKESFYWRVDDHLSEIATILGRRPVNENPDPAFWPLLTHINSVHVIPPNETEKSIPAFRPGNILVNCFLQSVMFIIDRDTKKIIWHKLLSKEPHYGAHRTKVLPNGHIFYFLNRGPRDEIDDNFYSSVEEYDPVSDKVMWRYDGSEANRFHAKRWCAVHLVNDDQFLVTVSSRGVVSQITRDGRILWEWHSKPENGKILPIYEAEPIEKSLVDPHIKVWKSLGSPLKR